MKISKDEEIEILKNRIEDLENEILVLKEKNKRGAGRKNISDDIKINLIKDYEDGMRFKDIKAKYDLSHSTIISIIQQTEKYTRIENKTNLNDLLNFDFWNDKGDNNNE